jgi:hypothetical protein
MPKGRSLSSIVRIKVRVSISTANPHPLSIVVKKKKKRRHNLYELTLKLFTAVQLTKKKKTVRFTPKAVLAG